MPSVGTISGNLVLNIGQWNRGVTQSLATTKVFQRDVNKVFKAASSSVDAFVRTNRMLKAMYVQDKTGTGTYLTTKRQLREEFKAALPGMNAEVATLRQLRANRQRLTAAEKAGIGTAREHVAAHARLKTEFLAALPGMSALDRAYAQHRASVVTLRAAMRAGEITMVGYRARLRNLTTEFRMANPPVVRLTMAMRAQAMAGRALVATGAAVRSSLLMYVGPLAAIYGAFKLFKMQEDVERGMRGSLAIMRNVGSEMKAEMRTIAIDVARETIHSTAQVTKAYYYLTSAGMDARQSLAAIPAVAEFAQAGMFELSLATDLLTDAQMAMGLSSKNAQQNLASLTRVGDVLVNANRMANATVQQFSEALTNKAAAAARLYGQSLEEVVSVLAIMASQGLKGEEAGTRYDIALRHLTIKALENAKAFKRMNIEVYDSAGSVRYLGDIIADMEKAFATMSTEQQMASMQMMGFGAKTITSTVALLGFSDEMKKVRDDLNETGAMAEVAGEQMTKFQKGWASLTAGIVESTSSLQEFIDSLGQAMKATGEFLAWANKLKAKGPFANASDNEAFAQLQKLYPENKEKWLSKTVKAMGDDPRSLSPLQKQVQQTWRLLKASQRIRTEAEKNLKDAGKWFDDLKKAAGADDPLVAKAFEDAADAASTFIAQLQFDAATEGMTQLRTEAQKLIDALPEGAAEIDKLLDAVARADKRADDFAAIAENAREATEAIGEVGKEIAKLTAFGDRLADQFDTPHDKFKKLIEDLLQWKDIMGKLPGWDEKLFDKGMMGAKQEALKGIISRDPSDFLTSTLSKGSAEAYREEIGGKQKNLELEAANKQIELTRKQIIADKQNADKIARVVGDIAVMEGEA